MEVGPALSPELLFAADPLTRGPPDVLRPPGRDATATGPPLAAFDLLLQMLGKGLPAGESLPSGGDSSPPFDGAAPAATPDSGSDLDAALLAALAAQAVPSAPMPTAAADVRAVSADDAVAPTAAAVRSPADRVLLAAAAAALAAASASQSDAATAATAGTAALAATAALGMPAGDSQAQTPSSLPSTGGAPAAQAPDPDASAPTSAEIPVLDMLRALEDAAREPASTPAVTPRREPGVGEPRDRAPRVTAPSQLVQAAADTAHAADESPALFDLKAVAAPVEAPAIAVKTAHLDDGAPISVALPAAAGDASSGSASASAFAPAGSHGTSSSSAAGTSAAAPQLPAQFQAPVDAHAARWHDAMASRIQWLVDHNVGEAQIKLNPPELGALDVKISMQDDKTFVQMTTHTSAARDELAQSLPRLRELLSSSGLDLGGATVSHGRDERGAFQPAPSPISRADSFAALGADETPIEVPHLSRLSGASRIDLFA
jgi:flagellar hook-length control protein FliK